ncbi:MAG: ATP-binding protein [Rhodothermales bacterium]
MSFERLRRLLRTVGVRLTAGYALLLLISLSLLFGLADWQLRLVLAERDHTAIRRELDELAHDYSSEGIRALEEELRENMVTSSPKRLFVRLADADGRTRWVGDWPPASLNLLEASEIPRDGSWRNVFTDKSERLEVATQSLPDGGYLQIGASAEPRHEILETFRKTFALAALPVLFLGLFGGLFVARRVLSPLHELASLARHIETTGKLDDRIPLRGTGDDLDELARQFNLMLDQIGRLLTDVRSTLDDVAHDLRTPMTRLRGHAELALQGIDSSEERCREALAESLESCDQVLAILNAIMDEAEAETGTLALHPEPISLGRLVDEVVELYQFVAEERHIVLEAHTTNDAVVAVDPGRIRQAVANLVDNAIKYTPEGGKVTLTVVSEGGDAVIRVRDTGSGVPEADLPHIWDRLYRGDRSRSTRGLGLGLSLVKANVEAHGGHVEVESRTGDGSVFTVRLRRFVDQQT